MITEDEALNLLRKYISDEKRIKHSLGVADIAFEIATKIKQKNPLLVIDPYRVKLAALLHDIGRAKVGVHEFNTIEILKNEGLADLAKIAFHGFVYETALLEKDRNADRYLPSSLENKIVIFADMHYNLDGQRVSLEERLSDIEVRFKDDKDVLAAVNLGKPRMEKLDKEIQSLM